MMTSSNGHIFRVAGPLWGEFTDRRWIPLTNANDAGLWCFLWSAPEQRVVQTIKTSVIWDAVAPITTSLQWRDMSVMAFSISGNSIICSGYYQRNHLRIILPVTIWFPSQRASDAESVSITWRHRVNMMFFSCWIHVYVISQESFTRITLCCVLLSLDNNRVYRRR